MKKEEIITKLSGNHAEFIQYIDAMDEKTFLFAQEGKWSPGQHLDHIIRSIKPLNQGLALPFFLLKLVFGKAHRNSNTYNETIQKYHLSLQNGGKASGKFIPKKVQFTERKELGLKLNNLIVSFTKHLSQLSEEQLDTLVLPHPLLGKITLREMLYFTLYHVKHHLEIVKS